MKIAIPSLGMAAAVPKMPTPVDGLSWHFFSGMLPVVAVVVLLLIGLLVWALFLRRTPRNRRDRLLTDDAPPSGRHRRHRRRERREHRPTNPTLAETGGLPPIKTDPPGNESA